MKTVAESPALNQAIADLSEAAAAFLCEIHRGTVERPAVTARAFLHELRELARCTGVDLNAVPSYQRNTTNWRAIARLAGSAVTHRTGQAG